jgi:hypothetical protein
MKTHQAKKKTKMSCRRKNVKLLNEGKRITTMKSTRLPEQGSYMEEEEESSESDSEEEEPVQEDKRRAKVRQANRRAFGDFVAVDQIDLEEEDEVNTPWIGRS